MLALPQELIDYWLSFSLADKSPAFFQVTGDGALMSWGGVTEQYSPLPLAKGTFIGEYFPFLAHSFPMQNVTESMQWIETEAGQVLDAHFHFASTQGWILFVDSGDEAQKVQSLMQQGNELKLLRQKYDKVVKRQLEREESSLILESLLDLTPEQHSTGISILQVRLNQQNTGSTASPPESLEILNQQLKAIFKVAVEEGGVINHVFGQTVAILFGLLPSPVCSAEQATYAAQRFVSECRNLSVQTPEVLIAMGITTGNLDIDLRAVKDRKIFHLIGQTIVRAEEMLQLLEPGILIIDQNTFNLAESKHSSFVSWYSDVSMGLCNSSFYAQRLNE